MSHEIVIDCPHCEVRVKASATTWVSGDPCYFLVECPSCNGALFGSAFSVLDDSNNWAWTTADRLWPTPSGTEVGAAVPEAARKDIRDAQKCLSSGIYSAAAVLCGRALERLVREKAGNNLMIGKGLAELKSRGIIDQRLLDWAEALRKERNIGAHASEQDTTKENAEDILDFTVAIFDYVYTLSEKYAAYTARKKGPTPP